MKLAEIEQEAMALKDSDKAILITKLIDSLSVPNLDVTDAEAVRRDMEIENGVIESITHDEFVRRVSARRVK